MTIASSIPTPTSPAGNPGKSAQIIILAKTTATTEPAHVAATQLTRQAAIENCLAAALWHVRHGDGPKAMQIATGRAIRAVAVLKQACSEAATDGRG